MARLWWDVVMLVPIALLEEALASVAALTAELAAMRVERAEMQAKLDAMTAKLDAVLAKKRKKAAPAQPPEPAPPPSSLDARPQPPAKPETDTEDRARKPRTKLPKPVLPTTEETVRPDVCAHCGGSRLQQKDSSETELIDYVSGYVRRRKIRRIRCRCADCAKVTAPEVPSACLPKTHFSAAFVAWVVYQKYALHLPLERIRGDLGRQGYPMSSSSISDLTQRALDELAGVADALHREALSGSYLHSDATGLPVVRPDLDHTHLGQMFFFGWGKLAVFRYAPDKKAETFQALLGDFQGTLVLDASSTHNLALEDGSIRWAGCNAHGLRKFREALESDPVLGAEGERWIASWFDQERVARERGLVGPELLAWRQEHIGPLASGFLRWLALVHPTVLPRSPLAEATRYYANYWRPLTAFLRDANLPLENNFAERNLRAQAVGRANWLFAGSDEAATNTAVAYTLVQTTKLHGLDSLAYLTWVLGRAARCRDGGGLYRGLTPAMYQEAQQRERGG